jgi:hypothetical protein
MAIMIVLYRITMRIDPEGLQGLNNSVTGIVCPLIWTHAMVKYKYSNDFKKGEKKL